MDPRKPIFDAIRTARGRGLTQADVEHIHMFLDTILVPREAVQTTAADPAWVTAGRSKLGEREVPGPKHNTWIAKGWATLGAGWFNDDETPWCGFFVAWCMQQAGLDYPPKGQFARALAWATWGVAVNPSRVPVGAVGVKQRKGGGHVFLIVGETADGRYWKALGGNQSNQVSVTDVLKTDVVAIRWPSVVPLPATRAPVMAAGTTGGSEA